MPSFRYNLTTTHGNSSGFIDATDKADAEKLLREQYSDKTHTTQKNPEDRDNDEIIEQEVSITSLDIEEVA